MAGVTGRFAPSPSGRMHLGNLLCSLLAWLSAKHEGGRVVLRIEDLDAERCPRKFADLLEADLRWLGLLWDEGGSTGGPSGPYYQSERAGIYETYFKRLTEMSLIYPCFCSRSQLHAASAPHRSDGTPVYSGACRGLSAEEVRRRAAQRPPAWRLRVGEETVSFTDGHLGRYEEYLPADCGDFVVRRGDGVFAYQLAVVVDDGAMGVTQVVRGSDLLSSTPRQRYLLELLGCPAPEYGHVPLLLAPDGRRLAKRDRDQELGALQQRFTARELVGRLAHLAGLIPEAAPVSPEELVPLFAWEKLPRRDIAMEPW